MGRDNVGVTLALASCAYACLYDSDNRCGSHQTIVDDICVCAQGYRLRASACEPIADVVATDAGAIDPEAGADAGGKTMFTGQRQPCTSDADCASYDANYCLTLYSVCLVPNCTEDSCQEGWSCLDVSVIVPGAPKVCVADEDLP